MNSETPRWCRPLCLYPIVFLLVFFANAEAQSIPEIRVLEPNGTDNLNPLTHLSSTGSYIGEYLYFSLVKTEKASGAYVPQLAVDLPKISEDGKSYSYELHPQARFNSGKKVTVRDVIFTMKLIKSPFSSTDHSRKQYDAIVAVVETGAQSFQVLLSHASSQGMRLTGDFPILSEDYFDEDRNLSQFSFGDLQDVKRLSPDQKDILRTLGERVNAFGNSFESYDNDAVSGPYLLQSWKRREELVLEANPKFWGRKVDASSNPFFAQNTAQISILFEADQAAIRSAVFNQTVDLISSMPAKLFFELSDIPSLQSKFQFHSRPGKAYEYLGMNMAGVRSGGPALLVDEDVRRAIAHLLNVDVLLEKLNYGLGDRLAADWPNRLPEFRNKDLELLKQDLDKAAALLEKAGWVDTDGNGLRDKVINGEVVQFVANCIYNEQSVHRKQVAEALQRAVLPAGMMVVPTPLSWEDYLAQLSKGDFDMYVGAWVADPNEDSYRQIWHTENQKGGFNFVSFGNAASDELIDRYEQTSDKGEKIMVGKVLQAMIYEQQPYVFLWSLPENLVVSQRLKKHPVLDESPGFWLGNWEL